MNDCNTKLLVASMPHPPIIIPEVGRGEEKKAQRTIDGINELSSNIVEFNPKTIVIVTPHSYMDIDKFNFYTAANLVGGFLQFGAPKPVLSFENDVELVSKIMAELKDKFNSIPLGTSIDHGSLVPLYYLYKAGYRGKVVIFNYCALTKDEHIELGKKLKNIFSEENKKIAFIASGDLSHRLIPEAPAGYNEQGQVFDDFVVENIKNGNYQTIINCDDTLRDMAGECAYNSLMVAFGILDNKPMNNKIYSYEGPFGVGYLNSTL